MRAPKKSPPPSDGPDTFCQIISGALAAPTVHRDGGTMSFLDHRPLFPGHVLLVPLTHVTTLADLPPAEVDHFFRVAQRLETAVERATGADGSLVLINNRVSQSVPHLHLHVIPRRFRDGLRFWLGPRRPYASAEEAERTAARIREALDLTGLTRPAGSPTAPTPPAAPTA
ncbi:MAG: histidine triad family protein [Mycobacteriales bacterium]